MNFTKIITFWLKIYNFSTEIIESREMKEIFQQKSKNAKNTSCDSGDDK